MRRFLFLLLLLPAVFAHSDEGVVFPAWTYWVEIVEHAATFAISISVIAFLLYRKAGNRFLVAGFGLFALAEFLTILHHFLIYPFGIWDSIVNHGLLLLAVGAVARSVLLLAEKK